MVIHTRFAPSPTGKLHLGHAWSAILAHDFARERGGRFSLRIEDIDGTRSRPEHVDAILRDLEWLGLGWDGEVTFQSRRLGLYQAALDRLMAGRATILIAHRLSTVKNADRIYVIDKGRVVETGTHAELVRNGALYARLAKAQDLDHLPETSA